MPKYTRADFLKAYYGWTATIKKDGGVINQFDRNDKWFHYCDVRDEMPLGESRRVCLNIKEETIVKRMTH